MGTGTSGGGPGGGGASGGGDDWHATNEAYANGRVGPGVDPNGTSFAVVKVRHAEIAQACGHAIEFEFDWASHARTEWGPGVELGSGRTLTATTPAELCHSDLLDQLSTLCREQPALVSSVRRVVCHAKPCDELPRSTNFEADKTPGHGYAWSDDRTAIHHSTCPRVVTSAGPEGNNAYKFFQTK